MRICVTVYGLLQAAVDNSEGVLELTLLEGADVAGAIEALREGQASSLFDRRSIIAVVDGEQVPLSRIMFDGEALHLYHTFTGG